MEFVVKTDVGMKRTVNEDRVDVFLRQMDVVISCYC